MSSHADFTLSEVEERGICLLRARGVLDFDSRKAFYAKAEMLLSSRQDKLVIDLTAANHIFSVYLGSIVDLTKRAGENNKQLVVLAKKKVVDLFEQANLMDTVNVVLVDKGG